MSIEEIVDWIREWECDAGESFNDYFTHGLVLDLDWLSYLREKGFDDRVEEILEETWSAHGCMDQQLLYDIYSYEGEWSEEIYRKDIALLAEFLINNPKYYDAFEEFIKQDILND